MRHPTVILLLLFVIALPVRAERFGLTTPGLVVRVSDPQMSPDGTAIAIVVGRANFAENRFDAEIVVVDPSTKAQKVLARGRRGIGTPRWSPDGSSVAFLAQGEGARSQIFIAPIAGGEPRQLTTSTTGVVNFAWRPDGGALAFTALDEEPKREGDDGFNRSFEVGPHSFLQTEAPRPVHLWTIDTNGSGVRRITSGQWSLPAPFPPGPPPPAPSWAPDGRTIAVMKLESVYSGERSRSTIQIVDVASGTLRPLTARSNSEAQPVFSPDGTQVAYSFPRDGAGRNVTELVASPAAGGNGITVTRSLDRHVLRGIWMPDSQSLLIAANDRTTTGIWLQPLRGNARRIDFGRLVPSASYGLDASVSRNGRIAIVASEPQRPAELYVLEHIDAKPVRLTDFNSTIASLELGATETIEWDGPDGFRMDGVVTYPPGYMAGRKYPLVLSIHGGPRATSKETFSPRAQLLAAHGWIVFEPNYRGSDNRGNAFMAAISNDAGAGPGRDVMSGVDVLKARGIVDGTRIAATGWSYGGYMTTWLLGNYPGVWRAAVAGAAVTDLLDQYTLNDHNAGRAAALGGSPFTDPKRMQAMVEQSPMTYASKIRTPTLILALTGDYRVPVTQSYRLYHALRDNKVPVTFVAYPLPGHNASDPVHQRDIDRRLVEWLRTHLEGTTGQTQR